jgi:hypothetical protein
MVPTLVLDEMVRVAGVYGSKITLLGDFAQMGSPEAGGLLRDLAALPTAVELTAVRRFRQPWEADASLQLRARQPDIAATYWREGRIVESSTDTVFDAVAAAWWADTAAGHRSLIVVDTASDAADVNTRCQHHLMIGGQLGDHVADAADGSRIHIGDVIQTRRNTREIPTSDRQRILNRDVWTVTGVSNDGSLHVKHERRGASAVLPAGYVAIDVVLGLRHHHRRRTRPHRRPRPRSGHTTHQFRVAVRGYVPGPRQQPHPCRVRQPRPHRIRTRRPHRRTSLRGGYAAGSRRAAVGAQRPAAVGDGTGRSHGGAGRRSQTTPGHRLVDGTRTWAPTRNARLPRRPSPRDPRRPRTTPQQRQPTTSDQQRRIVGQLAQGRRRRSVPTAPQDHLGEEPSACGTRACRKPRAPTSTFEAERA